MKKLIAKIINDDTTLLSINNVLNVSFGALDRGNVSDTTNWGCFSNKGEVVFIDSSKEFKSIVSNYENIKVRIYYVFNATEKLLATFLIDDYDYEDESGKVTITLKDSLMDWQQQNVEEYYEFVEQSIGEIWNSKYSNFAKKTENASAIMFRTFANTSYMPKSSRWSDADKICQATMLRCFCDIDGTPLFSRETSKQNNNIVIRPKNILSIGEKTKNTKTKISSVSISQKDYTKHENKSVLINEDGINFSWFNVNGTTDTYIGTDGFTTENLGYRSIIAKWVGEDGTSRIKPNPGVPIANYLGARVYRNVHFRDHVYGDYNASISVNKLFLENENTHIISETKLSTDDGTYNPTISTIKNEKNKVEIRIDDSDAFEENNMYRNNQGIVGRYVITNGNINLIGTYFSDDGEKTLGSGLSLQSNELIQTESRYETYIADELVSYNLAKYIIEKVKEKYENGVECVEMEVTPSDYYDNLGENVINSTGDKPLFEKYDIVTPYVVRNGVEQPYSKKQDGSAKSFKVIGIDYSYRGILRQKLYLQENV